MAGITAVSIRRPVATAMAFLILVVVGIVALRKLPIDLLPQIEFTQLTVRVQYPNVGPQEIEEIITDPIENAVSGLPNLERITSESEEGSSRVRLEFTRGTNVDEAANDLRAALDQLRDDFPIEAEPPEILKLDLDRVEVVSIAATSTRDLQSLTRILEEELARGFEQIPGVGAIEIRGGVYREIRIELDRDRLKASGLTALDVQEALGAENVNLPGGNVRSGFSDLYVRGRGEYRTVGQIARTVIAEAGGKPIRVQDVALVRDGYADLRNMTEINGVPSVGLGIQKQSGANTVAVAEAIRKEVDRINSSRDDLHLTVFSDQSDFIRKSIDDVRDSGLWGALLAIVVLYLFLRNRSSTMIIALSIPISIIATFGILYFGGMTLNQMTFGGLALGIGMIVDTAIVVLESIVRKREEEGMPAFEAARVGTSDVAGAIVASTVATCVVFLPLVFTRTTSGALFQALALVVVFSQACSLLVAFTLVPMMAARMRGSDFLGTGRRKSGKPGFTERLEGWYTRRLQHALQHRGRVFAATGILFAAALLLWPLIPVELTPPTDADEIDVEIEMAQGTSIAVVRSYVDELESRVREVLDPELVELVSTEVRGGDAEVELKLVPQEERSLSGDEVADLLRIELDGKIPGGEISVDAQPGLGILRRVFSSGGGEDDVEIELRGWDLEQADEIAAEIRRRVERIPGVTDVRVSRREGQREANLEFDRERISDLGLSVREVSRLVQINVGGAEAGRFREGGFEYPIVVRLRPEDRLNPQDLRNISLTTPEGAVVPLSSLVKSERARGPVSIERVDGQRVTYVTAGLSEDLRLGEAVERIRTELEGLALPEGYSLQYGGEYREQQEAQGDFIVAILMALALVYMLMAGQFERFIDPLIVMLSVPAALIGVVPVLLLTGTTLNIQSIMGLVMLIGIVVNNAIVLVDAVNLLRRERHMGAVDAVIEAGRLRLRPILMTTTATVLGLIPLALGLGAGAKIQAPLARVVVGGLTASTLVTLLLIPVTYVTVTAQVTRFKSRRWRKDDEPEQDRAATA